MRTGASSGNGVSIRPLLRAIVLALVLMLAAAVLASGSAWFKLLGPPKVLQHSLTVWFLAVVLDGYFWVWTAAVIGGGISGWLVWQMWRQEQKSSAFRPRRKSQAVRWLVLCASCICGLVFAEAAAGAWLAWLHRLPALPTRFADPPLAGGEFSIVVIGESSALGVPYDNWLSVGTIVGRSLEQAIPNGRFRVDVLAERGATLEDMHLKLSRITRKPDVLIVYSGHNEFLARFTLANQIFFYDDERTQRQLSAGLDYLSRVSPLLTLVRENLERQRVRVIPSLSLGVLDRAVGRPVCEPSQAARIVVDFEQRLEAIVSDCERVGCLPVLIIPPGNDAADPNRSYVSPGARPEVRRALGLAMERIRQLEQTDPAVAVAQYRRVVDEHPGYAHAHYRLARLLEATELFSEANNHYILARDHDGLPLRCLSLLEAGYRAVARRHGVNVVLVDGPAILRAQSRHGILDDELFHDQVHPTLNGHVALAQAVLTGLKSRGVFHWPAATPAPILKPDQCATQFGIDAAAWALVCERSAAQYDMLAFLTVDPRERVARRDRLLRAAKHIRAGIPLASLDIPGFKTAASVRNPDANMPQTVDKSQRADQLGP
jgi:hypothetical protein